jgi:hypothetical protein
MSAPFSYSAMKLYKGQFFETFIEEVHHIMVLSSIKGKK